MPLGGHAGLAGATDRFGRTATGAVSRLENGWACGPWGFDSLSFRSRRHGRAGKAARCYRVDGDEPFAGSSPAASAFRSGVVESVRRATVTRERQVRLPPEPQAPVVETAMTPGPQSGSCGPIQIDLRAQCYSAVGAAILRHYLPQVLDYTGHGERFGPRLPGVTRSRVVRVTAHSPQWMNFPGYWGEINLFHAPDPIGTRIAGPAPQTPTFHAIWTNPLATLRHWPHG
jgi:hypothetical protein